VRQDLKSFGAPRAYTVVVTGYERQEKALKMASNGNNSQSDSTGSHRDDPELTALERVQELTWALLDDEITEDDVSLLDTLLLTGESARNRYVECVQLHTDLMTHFANEGESDGKGGEKLQIMSFLNASSSNINMPSPRPAE
jgi:hypothetical protein